MNGIPSYTIKTDSTSTADTVYIGRCNSIDADDDGATWSIQRITFSGDDIVLENADGDDTPNKVWSDRTTLTYK